jgi:hypothetical protein
MPSAKASRLVSKIARPSPVRNATTCENASIDSVRDLGQLRRDAVDRSGTFVHPLVDEAGREVEEIRHDELRGDGNRAAGT